jgi:hypothetical protein
MFKNFFKTVEFFINSIRVPTSYEAMMITLYHSARLYDAFKFRS